MSAEPVHYHHCPGCEADWPCADSDCREHGEYTCPDCFMQERIQGRIYRGELEATDADGVQTMGGQL